MANQLEFLKQKYDAGQLAHAYIFSGHDMQTLQSLANELALHANCKFPDLITISSIHSESSVKNEKDMMEIDVDQVRQAQQFLSYKSYNGGLKAVIVTHAERMNAQAQNCFLKSLEEPKGQTLIMLLAEKPEFLLPTIASRCQAIVFSGKTAMQEPALSEELSRVISADLAEKFKYAKGVNLEGENFGALLNALQRHFRSLLLAQIGVIDNANLRMDLHAPNYSIEKLKKIIRLIEQTSYQAATTNQNNKLALEIVLLEL